MSQSREKPRRTLQGGLSVRGEVNRARSRPPNPLPSSLERREYPLEPPNRSVEALRSYDAGRSNSESVLRLHSNVSSARSVSAELCSLLSLWNQNASQLSQRRTANDNRSAGPFTLITT